MSMAKLAPFGRFVEGDVSVAIPPVVAPLEGDTVVTKRRVSAFTGSDLEAVLRCLEVESLVLAGVANSGVVLSTVRQAADLDYRLTVLKDLCMDQDPDVHRILVDKVFPRQVDMMTSDQWMDGLGSG